MEGLACGNGVVEVSFLFFACPELKLEDSSLFLKSLSKDCFPLDESLVVVVVGDMLHEESDVSFPTR